MALTSITLRPGIQKQTSPYGAKGQWVDCDNVRFRYGLPEKIGGWLSTVPPSGGFTLLGVIRDFKTWTILSGNSYAALGGNWKLYIYDQNAFYDITPTRTTFAPASNLFTTVSGSKTVTVSIASHGASAGNFVTFSGVSGAVGGIPAATLGSQYQVNSVADVNNFTIVSPTSATASVTSGGSASTVVFQVNNAPDRTIQTGGWGTSVWGLSTWGTARSIAVNSVFAGSWSLDNYGQQLIATAVGGGTYMWDATTIGVGGPAVTVTGAPTTALFNIVSNERSLFLFGTETTIGTPSTLDLLMYRWSSTENINDWNPTAINTAGFLRTPDGTQLIAAIKSRGQILVWTDNALYGVTYIGPPYTYGQQQLATNCGAVSRRSAVDVNGQAFWMSKSAFFTFDGTVHKIPCTVLDYVFKTTGSNPGINTAQYSQIYAGLDSLNNEIHWFYPSAASNYNDSRVTYNYVEQVWTVGSSWSRTSWVDRQIFGYPYGTLYDSASTVSTTSSISPVVYGLQAGRSRLVQHEYGNDADGLAMVTSLTSADTDLPVAGEQVAKMSRFIPDFQNFSGSVNVNVEVRNYSAQSLSPSSNSPFYVTPTTNKIDTRARGRTFALQISSSNLGDTWRFATFRADLQPDGMR
jgi:hypothetical protein